MRALMSSTSQQFRQWWYGCVDINLNKQPWIYSPSWFWLLPYIYIYVYIGVCACSNIFCVKHTAVVYTHRPHKVFSIISRYHQQFVFTKIKYTELLPLKMLHHVTSGRTFFCLQKISAWSSLSKLVGSTPAETLLGRALWELDHSGTPRWSSNIKIQILQFFFRRKLWLRTYSIGKNHIKLL